MKTNKKPKEKEWMEHRNNNNDDHEKEEKRKKKHHSSAQEHKIYKENQKKTAHNVTTHCVYTRMCNNKSVWLKRGPEKRKRRLSGLVILLVEAIHFSLSLCTSLYHHYAAFGRSFALVHISPKCERALFVSFLSWKTYVRGDPNVDGLFVHRSLALIIFAIAIYTDRSIAIAKWILHNISHTARACVCTYGNRIWHITISHRT